MRSLRALAIDFFSSSHSASSTPNGLNHARANGIVFGAPLPNAHSAFVLGHRMLFDRRGKAEQETLA
jgi:hypothetical protein